MKSFAFSVLALGLFVYVDAAVTAKFKVDYVLTDANLYPNGEIPGTLYYKYDSDVVANCKVRYEHSLTVGSKKTTVVELEDFGAKRIFKICGRTCEAHPFSRNPQQWWFKTGDSKDSGSASGGYYRYTRSYTDYGVNELWLKNENAPTSSNFPLKRISFSSGRKLELDPSSYSVTVDDQKFNPNAGGVVCSTETCRTFMDLVFVLDSSGSVGAANWQIMVNFIKDVINRLDISAQSAAIAVIAFGGQTYSAGSQNCRGNWLSPIIDDGNTRWRIPTNFEDITQFISLYDINGNFWANATYDKERGVFYRPDKGWPDGCISGNTYYCPTQVHYEIYEIVGSQKIRKSYYARCGTDFNIRTSSDAFLSATYVPLTYAPKADIMNDIQNRVIYKGGDTCQALGLQRTIDVFNTDYRGQQLGVDPQRIVIVITDGDDHCGNMTKTYAKIIREQYKATLIEVSITLKHKYDKELLENMSSTLGGAPSYFDVSEFKKLNDTLDKIISVSCDVGYSDASGKCDAKCKGFCGCGGECFCPDCDSTLNNKCHSYSCTVRDNLTAGCVDSPTNCNDGLHCTKDSCDNSTGCKHVKTSCPDSLPNRKCVVSTCSEVLEGKCTTPVLNHSSCPKLYDCYTPICDPTNSRSDSVTGCRYEYACTDGELPVKFDTAGNYLSGCYKYTCSNSSNKCVTIDFCDELAKSDKCFNYVCDKKAGKCRESTAKVNCPTVTACRPQSTCNRATGQCDVVEITATECKNRLKTEAKTKHTGTGSGYWFETNEAVDSYYNCGTPSCDVNAPNPSANPTINQIGNCVFTEGDASLCGVCSGNTINQPTVDSCEQEAAEMHEQNKDTCYTSSCEKTGAYSSKCNFVAHKCEHKGCMIATCNQSTLQCDYVWTQAYLDAQKQVNLCNELQCNNDNPEIVNISIKKCVGTNGENVPTCKVYDHCDVDNGCVYDVKCKSDNKCIIASCNETVNQCVFTDVVCEDSHNVCFRNECIESTGLCEAVVIPLEEACEAPDQCHTLTCSVLENRCVYEQIPFPNETDKCHNYTCHGDTGEWTVVEKCDDDDICTIDTCAFYDGSCTNFKRDCHELDLTGYGSCFGRSCSKLRKNGCFRRVYENSYFDECGNCIRGYSAEDSGVTESEVTNCKKALTFQEQAVIISAGVLAGIIIACVVGALAVSAAGTLATRELIRRARAANSNGAHDNPLFQDNGREMENPAFEGNDE